MKEVKINALNIAKVLDYLSKQPYGEVAELMAALRNDIMKDKSVAGQAQKKEKKAKKNDKKRKASKTTKA